MKNKLDTEYKRNTEIKPGELLPPGMHRWALCVEYSGTGLNGFQKQTTTVETVQQKLESALSKVANEPIALVCAGRTDAGVHATGQVIHFDTLAVRHEKAWVQGVNTYLPDGIRVYWGREVGPYFHARFSAERRTYHYLIHSAQVRSAVLQKQVTWTQHALDLESMQSAVVFLLGVHDFSAFRAAQCQAKSPVREVGAISIVRKGGFLVLEISANAFLHHMVRNIVGSIIEVGRGRQAPQWLASLLEGRDRALAAPTAPPHGLYLVEVEYPRQFGLPQKDSVGPPFFG